MYKTNSSTHTFAYIVLSFEYVYAICCVASCRRGSFASRVSNFYKQARIQRDNPKIAMAFMQNERLQHSDTGCADIRVLRCTMSHHIM